MKKQYLILSIMTIAFVGASLAVGHVEKNSQSDQITANIEAMSGGEVVVGTPCWWSPAECYTINDEFGKTTITGYRDTH